MGNTPIILTQHIRSLLYYIKSDEREIIIFRDWKTASLCKMRLTKCVQNFIFHMYLKQIKKKKKYTFLEGHRLVGKLISQF